jgi:hypothetical protein
MKALSIWQPWASLIMSGHKKIETRSWPAPYPIRGQRIAIASTKTVRPERRDRWPRRRCEHIGHSALRYAARNPVFRIRSRKMRDPVM